VAQALLNQHAKVEPMKFAELAEPEILPVTTENVVRLPLGLLGFEHIKQYVLLSKPDEAPFVWLQMLDDPNLAFLVVAPSAVISDYYPDISPEEVEFLGLADSQDTLVFNIVTLRSSGTGTVNLKGPIIVNRNTLIGKQVVPLNAMDYSSQHPLPI
jgi:flagellar assembly factor FliW